MGMTSGGIGMPGLTSSWNVPQLLDRGQRVRRVLGRAAAPRPGRKRNFAPAISTSRAVTFE